jgi:hypothetical protein
MTPSTNQFPFPHRDEFASITARLLAVERSQRRWRMAAFVLAVSALGTAVIGMSAPPTRTVDAEVIRILDAKGTTRMILHADENGPALAILDEKGRLRANLGVATEGPSLDLLVESENPRAQLTVDQDQNPHLDFVDSKGVQVSLRP